jgi:beta-glucuronidase
MHRRIYLSILCAAGYMLAALAMSLAPHFAFWQCIVILWPVAFTLAGLAWTTPHPDFTAAVAGEAAPIEDLANPSRKVIWLNDPWEFKLEKEKRWRRLEIPRPLNTIRGLEYYSGKGTYRRLVKLPESWPQGTVFLRCRGANYRSVVSIDGRQLGTHEGGFTPFEFEVTDRLADSREHEIEIEIDNTIEYNTVPNVVGWSNDGGILREIYLETRNLIHIDDVFLYPMPDMKGRADLALIIKLHNPALEPRDYKIEIFSPQGALIHEHKVEGWTMQTLQHRTQINFAALWSAENPALYRCRVSIIEKNGDEMSFPFGIRSIETKPEGLFLNGGRIKLHGITRIEESPRLGCTQTTETIVKDLEAIKSAGFNTVRLGPFPAHSKTLELCDKMGLMVLEEIPVWNTLALDFSDPGYQQSAETQLRELVLRDRNHPCVIGWGLATGIESEASEARWFIERLAGLSRGLDGRPVYITTSDPAREMCADLVDFIGVDMKSKSLTYLASQAEAAAELGAPVVLFHQGVPAYRPAGTRAAGVPGTEEHQARFLLDFAETFEAHSAAAGGWVISSLADFRDPSNFFGAIPFERRHGLLSRDRTERIAYGAMTRWLRDGHREELEIRRKKLPTTSFAKIFAFAWLILAAAALVAWPRMILKLAYDPAGFAKDCHYAWAAMLFVSLFTALNFAVLIYRFFRTAPRRLLGSIDMPFFILTSHVVRSESTLLLWTYSSTLWFWIANTTLLGFVMHNYHFAALLCLTSAICLPDIVFVCSAFFRLPIAWSILVFNIWKVFICYKTLGLLGTASYVLLGPAIITIAALSFIEFKFHIAKYIRKMI